MRLEPVTPGFAAVARGIDLAQPLAPDAVAAIVRAIDEFAVLVFPDQPLSSAQLVALGEHFGPLDRGLQQKLLNDMQTRIGNDAVSDISNLDASGQVAARDHAQVTMNVGNRFWHTD